MSLRRALLVELPLWSRLFGLHPFQIESLTIREIAEYRAIIQRIYSEGGDPWQVAASSSSS